MKYKIKNYVIDAKSPVEALKVAKIMDSMKDRVPDDVVKKYQDIVDRAIASYGRIGAGLYDDLDQAGLWVDDRSGKYIVKRKVEDSIKDADWSKARYKKFNKGDRIKFKTLNKYVRTGTVEKDEGPHVIVRTDDFNSLERVEKDNIYDVIVFDSTKDSSSNRTYIFTYKTNKGFTEKFVCDAPDMEEARNQLEDWVIEHNQDPYKIISKEVRDSIKDSDVDFLSEEEQKAISQYREAIHNTSNPELLELYRHILEEEIEHYNELQNAKTTDLREVYDITDNYTK